MRTDSTDTVPFPAPNSLPCTDLQVKRTFDVRKVIDEFPPRKTYYCDDVNYKRKGLPNKWSDVTKKNGSMFMSYPVFSFIPSTRDTEQPVRYGSFVIDIDTHEIACSDAIKIITWFSDVYGIEAGQWKIFLSGKKGVHLELASSILGAEQGATCLPLAYKRLAKDIEGELGITLDTSMYNMGTGKPYRQPNVMRETGTCKRQIKFDDLYEISDEEEYRDTCKNPGKLWEPEETGRNTPLAKKIFQYLNEATEIQNNIGEIPPISEDLAAKLASHTPPCITMLKDVTNQRNTGATFNDVAMQLTAYCISSGFSENDLLVACNKFIFGYPSSSLTTEEKRKSNCIDRYRTMSANNYQHSCSAIKSLRFGGYSCNECFMSKQESEYQYTDDDAPPEINTDKKKKRGLSLMDFALSGGTKKLKEKLKESTMVLDGIAVAGELTAIGAPPNGGKTLLVLKGVIDAVAEGRVEGEKVFYINCDDNQRGAICKAEIAEEHGINMIVPVLADRDKTGGEKFNFIPIINEMIRNGLDGEIIILDTYKKFTSVMKKDDQSEFNEVLRNFVTAGGTVIVLAHTTKRPDRHTKKYELNGTSDLKDDVDCCWISVPTKTESGIRFDLEFEKGRGVDGEPKSFHVTKYPDEEDHDKRYRMMLDSIVPMDTSDISDDENRELARTSHQAITLIREELAAGKKTMTELVEAYKDSDVKHLVSRRDFINVLHSFAGEMWLIEKVGRYKVCSLKQVLT